jgi:hypothetical protein
MLLILSTLLFVFNAAGRTLKNIVNPQTYTDVPIASSIVGWEYGITWKSNSTKNGMKL